MQSRNTGCFDTPAALQLWSIHEIPDLIVSLETHNTIHSSSTDVRAYHK